MKKTYWVGIVIIILIALFFALSLPSTKEDQEVVVNEEAVTTNITTNMADTLNSPVEVQPITHATAILRWENTTIYIDPTGDASAFQGKSPANIIVVTDIHSDHFSTSTLAATISNAALIVPQAVKDSLPAELAARATVLKNGETITEQGFQITGIPMYNLPESAESRHTKGRGNGYVIERNGDRVYIAGDTAGIPEMRMLTDIDVAFVPMNLPFTMGVEEAASAVLEFKPKQVYPYHYRGQDGLSDVNKFKGLVNAGNPNIEVVLLDWYPEE